MDKEMIELQLELHATKLIALSALTTIAAATPYPEQILANAKQLAKDGARGFTFGPGSGMTEADVSGARAHLEMRVDQLLAGISFQAPEN